MRISIRLLLVSLSLALLISIFAFSWLSYDSAGSLNDNTVEIATNWLPSTRAVNSINTTTSDFRIAEGSHILSTDPTEMARAEKDIRAADEHIKAIRKEYGGLISAARERTAYESFSTKWSLYKDLHKEMLELSRANKNEEASVLFKTEMRSAFDEASAILGDLSELNQQGSLAAYNSSSQVHDNVVTAIIVAMTISTLIGLTMMAYAVMALPIQSQRLRQRCNWSLVGNWIRRFPSLANETNLATWLERWPHSVTTSLKPSGCALNKLKQRSGMLRR